MYLGPAWMLPLLGGFTEVAWPIMLGFWGGFFSAVIRHARAGRLF